MQFNGNDLLTSNKSFTCQLQASVNRVLKRPSADLKAEDRRYLSFYSMCTLISLNHEKLSD